MIRVVLVDVDNTILSFDGYVQETMRRGFSEFGIIPYEDSMFSVFTRINNGLWQQIERGELTFGELEKIRWNLVFRELGAEFDGVVFEKYFRDCLFDNAIPEPGAAEALSYLQGKYVLGVASNGPYDQQINRLRVAGFYPFFRYFFISEKMGAGKPSREFFDLCVGALERGERTAFQRDEIVILGDSLTSDIAGGNNGGIKTCYLNRKGKPVPEGVKVDWEIGSLKEIPGIL